MPHPYYAIVTSTTEISTLSYTTLFRSTRQPDGSYVIRGSKRWIGNGAAGGITLTFARVHDEGAEDHGKVRGFLVPQDSLGYTGTDRKSTRLNSSHVSISYAVFCLKKKR